MPSVHDRGLLVEDQATLADLYALGVEREGYVVTVVPDGLTASPILGFSNYRDPKTVRHAFELGAADYLLKSDTTPGELAQQVRRVMGDADARSSLR